MGKEKPKIKRRKIIDDRIYKTIVENSNDLISVINFSLHPRFLYVSPSHEDVLGYKSTGLLGKKIIDFIHPDDHKIIMSLLKKYLENKAKILLKTKKFNAHDKIEIRFKHKNKEWRYLQCTADLVSNQIVVVSRDISEEKKIIEKIKDSENRLSVLYDNAPDAIFITDLLGVFVDMNRITEKIIGKKKKNLIGKSILGLDILGNKEVKKIRKIFLANGEKKIIGPIEIAVNTKLDEKEYFEMISYPVTSQDQTLSISIARRTTEKKKIKEKLKRERNKLRQYIDIAGVILLTLDIDGNILLINKKGCDVLGYSQAELIGQNWIEKIIRPQDRGELLNIHRLNIQDKIIHHHNDNFVLAKDAKEKMMSWDNTLLKNKHGDIIGTLSSGEEITGKKKKDLALKQAAKEWSDTFDSMADGVSIHDSNFVILNVNNIICDLLVKDKEEIIGKKCFNLFHDLNHPIKMCPLARSKKTNKRESVEYYEKKIAKWLSVTVSPVKKNGKTVKYIHIVRDITNRKKAELETDRKNRDLRLFNKVATGRELKMIKLKKKIIKLERELGSKK